MARLGACTSVAAGWVLSRLTIEAGWLTGRPIGVHPAATQVSRLPCQGEGSLCVAFWVICRRLRWSWV
jgi:hypothetical protein